MAEKVCRDWEWTWQEINEKEWEELFAKLDECMQAESGKTGKKPEGVARRVVRETCKFFTTRAGKKENRLGERASEWGKYESAHGDFTEGFQRYVGSRNWIEFEMALAIWVAHLPFNAPEFMKVVELDSTGPLTAYTKEFMESGQDGYTQLGLRIFAACHQQITSLARFYIASADTML